MTDPTLIPGEYAPLQTRTRVAFWFLLGIAAFYLLIEHRLHLAGLWRWLPMLVLLACPLMHLFGHGGHSGHAGHKTDRARPEDAP